MIWKREGIRHVTSFLFQIFVVVCIFKNNFLARFDQILIEKLAIVTLGIEIFLFTCQEI